MTSERASRRRRGARRAPPAAEVAERSGSVTSRSYREGSLARRSNPFPLVGLWLSFVICFAAAVRLDPLLNSRTHMWYAHPNDPFGHWVDDWIAGPLYPTYRVIARLLINTPILLGIGYEIWLRGPTRARGGAPRRRGLVGDVSPSRSRVPVRWPWIALAAAVIVLAVADGRAEVNREQPGLRIGIIFIGALWAAGSMAGPYSGAQPRDGDVRTESGTEANP